MFTYYTFINTHHKLGENVHLICVYSINHYITNQKNVMFTHYFRLGIGNIYKQINILQIFGRRLFLIFYWAKPPSSCVYITCVCVNIIYFYIHFVYSIPFVYLRPTYIARTTESLLTHIYLFEFANR